MTVETPRTDKSRKTETSGDPLGRILETDSAACGPAGERSKLEQRASDAVANLGESARVIVSRRYGLGGAAPQNADEIAQALNSSREGGFQFTSGDVDHHLAQALRDLRRSGASRPAP